MDYITLHSRPSISVHVRNDVRRWSREHRRSWFDQNMHVPKGVEQDAHRILAEVSITDRSENRQNMELLLTNLLAPRNQDRRSIYVSLQPTKWTRTRYRRTSYGMPSIIHRLHDGGYVGLRLGYKHEKHAEVSRIWARQKLLQSCLPLPPRITYDPVEVVVLKDSQGELKDYRDTVYTRQLRQQLHRINRVNGTAEIRLNLKRYQGQVHAHLHASFNEDFQHGGRLYTSGFPHVQGLKASERLRITINGESVVEVDFQALHPHLLYALEGRQLARDPYTLAGYEDTDAQVRRFVKVALMALLNASDFTLAQAAANTWLIEHPHTADRLKGLGLYPARPVLSALQDQHQFIRHHFGQGKNTGLKLANQDAKIALGIVRQFTRQGIPILPVHDSFIVQSRYQAPLEQVMKSVYKQHTHGFEIPIKSQQI